MGKLSDFLKYVNNWIGRHEVIDSPTVTWEQNSDGIKAHVSVTPSGGVGSSEPTGAIGLITNSSDWTGGNIYDVTLYDSPNGTMLGRAIAMPLMLHPNEILENGQWIAVNRSSVKILSFDTE